MRLILRWLFSIMNGTWKMKLCILLDMAPEHPMVQIWQAWLLDRAGYQLHADAKLMQAADASPDLVFPFRPEMVELFSWANQIIPRLEMALL